MAKVTTGYHTVDLDNGCSLTVRVRQKGLDWAAEGKLYLPNGSIANVVECGYRYEYTTMQDIMDDMKMLCEVGVIHPDY